MHSHRLSSSSISVSPPPSPQPTTASIPNKNSRAEQIVQSFYGKVVQVVLQSRVVPLPSSRDRSAQPYPPHRSSPSLKQNRWFNLETDEIEAFKSEARFWRNASVAEDPVPPLIMEIFLDTSELSASQSLVLVDKGGHAHKIELNQGARFHQFGRSAAILKKTILLESWCLLSSGTKDCQVELPTIYKNGITHFRSLQSLVKMLPSTKLNQRLKTSKKHGFKIGYRLSTAVSTIDSEIGFGHPASSDDNVLRTSRHDLAPFDTPLGKLRLAVTFREFCDFYIEDSEKLLSARFQGVSNQSDAIMHGSRNSFSHRINQDSGTFGNFEKSTGDNSQFTEQDSQTSSVASLSSGVGNRCPIPPQTNTYSTSPGRWSQSREFGVRSRPSSQDQDSLFGPKGSMGVPAFSTLKSSPPSHMTSSRRSPSITMFSPFKSPSLSSSPSLHNASPPSRTSSFGNRSSVSLERGLFQPSNRATPPPIRPTSPAPTKISSSFGHRFGSFSGNQLPGEQGGMNSSSGRRTPSLRSVNPLDRSQGIGSTENLVSLSSRPPNDDLTEFMKILSNPPAIKAAPKPIDVAHDDSFGKNILDHYKKSQPRFEALTAEIEACVAKTHMGIGQIFQSPATSPLRQTGFNAESDSSEARSLPNPIHDRLLTHCAELAPTEHGSEVSSFPERRPPRTSLLSQKLSTQKFTSPDNEPSRLGF